LTTSSNALQLALSLAHAESFAREDFVAGPSNARALALIDAWPDWPDPIVALVGPKGSGKSHLASIWGEKSGARFLSGRLLAKADPLAMLSTGALVIEDLPPRLDEVEFFHLLNLARQEKAHVLLTTRTQPALWQIGLPDLASRVRALTAIALTAPDDFLLRAVLMKLAADRQIDLEEPVLSYLAPRVERSFAGVQAAVDRLDQEAMRQHRPVTRALAAELFRDTAF
jgi:chromosomal replication initiation ATPase DnaA